MKKSMLFLWTGLLAIGLTGCLESRSKSDFISPKTESEKEKSVEKRQFSAQEQEEIDQAAKKIAEYALEGREDNHHRVEKFELLLKNRDD